FASGTAKYLLSPAFTHTTTFFTPLLASTSQTRLSVSPSWQRFSVFSSNLSFSGLGGSPSYRTTPLMVAVPLPSTAARAFLSLGAGLGPSVMGLVASLPPPQPAPAARKANAGIMRTSPIKRSRCIVIPPERIRGLSRRSATGAAVLPAPVTDRRLNLFGFLQFQLLLRRRAALDRDLDPVGAALAPTGRFVPADEAVLAGRRVLDLETAVGVGHGEIRVVVDP